MKVILYMAITINGFIAKENDDTSFVSKNSWREYKKMVGKSDCVIVGSRTYEIMPPEEFNKRKLYIVLTHKANLKKKANNIKFTNEDPKFVLESLEKEGFNKALVAGGGTLNTSFMSENLVDEIYLDIEPTIFSRGIRLFAEADFETKLELIATKKLSKNEIQLHYKIKK